MTALHHERVLRRILAAAAEDEYGLHEIRWIVNTDFREVPEEERNELCAWVVRELVNRGWATVSRLDEDTDGNAHAAGADSSWDQLLDSPRTWEAPPILGIVATPAGYAACHRG